MATKKKTSKGMLAAEIGAAAVAAAAAAGAGYYFYASKDAKKHRKIAAKWADKLQKEVVREAKKVKTLDAKTVAMIIDDSAAAYATAKSINRADLARAVKELKANWQKIAVARMPAKARKVVRKVKKTVKKVRKAAKKGRR
jgi:hypothetical protein